MHAIRTFCIFIFLAILSCIFINRLILIAASDAPGMGHEQARRSTSLLSGQSGISRASAHYSAFKAGLGSVDLVLVLMLAICIFIAISSGPRIDIFKASPPATGNMSNDTVTTALINTTSTMPFDTNATGTTVNTTTSSSSTTTVQQSTSSTTSIPYNYSTLNATSLNQTIIDVKKGFGRGIDIWNGTSASGQTLGVQQINNMSPISSIQAYALMHNFSSEISGGEVSVSNYTENFSYGQVMQNGALVAAGSNLTYAVYGTDGVLSFVRVNVTKAVPQLRYSIAGVSSTQGTLQSPEVIHLPVINGRKTYALSVGLSADLLNSLNLTYTVRLSNGTVLTENATNAGTLQKQLSFPSIPVSQNATITFDAQGNANYTSIDPVAIIIPTEIVYYVPITYNNLQSTAVATGTPLYTAVNALAYKSYYTANVNNAEFFTPNGMLLDSWLEGNTANELQTSNLYTSTNLLYWVKAPANFLAASSSNTIYLGWAGNVVTPANNLLSNTITGVAPQLFGTTNAPGQYYSEYDDGNYVFSFYDDFFTASSLSSKWSSTHGGTVTLVVSNSVEIEATARHPAGIVTASSYSSYPYWFEALLLSSSTSSADKYTGPEESTSNTFGTATDEYGYENGEGTMSTTTADVYSASFAANGLGTFTSLSTAATRPQVLGVAWAATGTQKYEYSAYTTSSGTNGLTIGNNYFSLIIANTTTSEAYDAYYQWARARIYPPNGVNPTVTFGGTVSQVMSVSFNPPGNQVIDLGQAMTGTATVSGGISPYTYNWIVTNSLGSKVFNSLVTSSSASNTISNTLGKTGSYTVNLIVTDNGFPNPQQVAESFNVLVNNALSVSVSPASNTVTQGLTAYLTGTTSEGTPSYAYQWLATTANGDTYNSLNANVLCAGTSQTTATCDFGTGVGTPEGTYHFELQVTDSATNLDTVTSNAVNVIVNAPQVSYCAAAGITGSTAVSTSSGCSLYFCAGSNYGYTMTDEWSNDVVTTYASSGNQTSSTCTASASPDDNDQSVGIIGFNGIDLGDYQIINSPTTFNAVTSFSSTYSLGSTSDVLIMVACGYDPCNSVSLPPGCTTEVSENIGTDQTGTVAISYCSDQALGAYTISGSTVANPDAYVSVEAALIANSLPTVSLTFSDGNSTTQGTSDIANGLTAATGDTVEIESCNGLDCGTPQNIIATGRTSATFDLADLAAGNYVFDACDVNAFACSPANAVTIAPLVQCTISLSPNSLSFGTLNPTANTATQNVIIDTNSQTAAADILIYGTDWTGIGSNSFGVGNTVWAGALDTLFSDANTLTYSAVLTGLQVSGDSSANVYIGAGVPGGVTGGAYTQNIVIENSC